MFGLNGRIVRVNLTDGKSSIEKFSESIARKYIGGKGLAINLLYRDLKPE